MHESGQVTLFLKQIEPLAWLSLTSRMRFLRNFVLGTLVLLVFCSVMTIRQFAIGDSRHVEQREAFLLLVKKGYTQEANEFYERLMLNLQELSDKTLVDDMQRAAMLVDVTKTQTDNLVWRFYWSIHNELEKRAEIRLGKVLEKAESK